MLYAFLGSLMLEKFIRYADLLSVIEITTWTVFEVQMPYEATLPTYLPD